MALDLYEETPLREWVADRVLSPTFSVCQQAELTALLHNYGPIHEQDPRRRAQVAITVCLAMFEKLADGTPGAALEGEGFGQRERTFWAKDDTLVDASDPMNPDTFGQALAIRRYTPGEDWQAVLDSFTQKTMYQATFFAWLRDEFPIRLGPIIRRHIQTANAAGLFA
jgi:hypothetical protein